MLLLTFPGNNLKLKIILLLCMQINVSVLCKLMLSLLVGVVRQKKCIGQYICILSVVVCWIFLISWTQMDLQNSPELTLQYQVSLFRHTDFQMSRHVQVCKSTYNLSYFRNSGVDCCDLLYADRPPSRLYFSQGQWRMPTQLLN